MTKRWWLVVLGAVGGGVIAAAIAWQLAGDDVNKLGDWRHGALRFIGMVTTLGIAVGYLIARQLAGKTPHTRDGFTLSYRRIDPKAEGYREMVTPRVADLLAALSAVGYAPTTEQCDDTGEPCGAIDPQTPLAGANLMIRDPGVRGHIRVQLALPIEGRPRSLGVLEIWSKSGDSTEELAMFTLRALDKLVDGVTAARESSVLSEDTPALLTAGLGERPIHRKA
jgi:hypothetical protein